MVQMEWNSYSLKAVVFRTRQVGKSRLYYWTFTASDINHPYFFRAQELPMLAMFVLECHQRLSQCVKDESKLNLQALNP